jgi:two-component system, OmpR family, response regulator ChvI
MPTIAVIDRDSAVLALVKDVFEVEGFDVLLYLDGVRALDAFETKPPDVVVTEVRMPEMDGIELLRRLRQKSNSPVIFLSSRVDESDELIALRIGADDFIRKPFSPRVLIERVRAVLRRPRSMQPDDDRQQATEEQERGQNVIKRGDLRMDKDRYTCTWKGHRVDLTTTEFHLLESMATRPGTTKSRSALRDLVYDDQVIDDRMIDSHIKRVRKKFRAVDETFDEIKSVYGIGYRFGQE